MEDLWELAWGIIAGEDFWIEHPQMQSQVRGLCEAFQSIGKIIVRDNWFHSRDFIFLCRLLRVKAGDRIFDSSMLLSALRRHFQPLEPTLFPALASHFLDKCGLKIPPGDGLEALVLASLRESLTDTLEEGSDPTSAHCRYTLVVDPTDCEAAVDLMFALKLLDQRTTKVVSLSDFPEDSSPTMTTAVLAQVMGCIEEGETLLLVNSGPLQSALYDVINRHYAVSVRDDGRREAFANIPLGSFSSLIRVHASFRLIVHVPASQLPRTPMPFLNRLEKYTLSVRDALAQRVLEVSLKPPSCLKSISKPEHRQRFFMEIEAGVNDFVAFCGGSTSFYGMSGTETVPALVLRALEDACVSTSTDFEPRHSVLAAMLLSDTVRKEFEGTALWHDSDESCSGVLVPSGDESVYVDAMAGEEEQTVGEFEDKDSEKMKETVYTSPSVGSDFATSESRSDLSLDQIALTDTGDCGQEGETRIDQPLYNGNRAGDGFVVPCDNARRKYAHDANGTNDPASTRLREIIRALNFQIMETARVESLFRLRTRLPATYMREYLEGQEHLSVISLLRQMLKSSPETNVRAGVTSEKLVVYTRTDRHLLRIVTDSAYAARVFSLSAGGSMTTFTPSATATATATASVDMYSIEHETVIVSSMLTAPQSLTSHVVCIIPLAAFLCGADCARTIRACMRPDGGRRMLIIVADMKQVLHLIFVLLLYMTTSDRQMDLNISSRSPHLK